MAHKWQTFEVVIPDAAHGFPAGVWMRVSYRDVAHAVCERLAESGVRSEVREVAS